MSRIRTGVIALTCATVAGVGGWLAKTPSTTVVTVVESPPSAVAPVIASPTQHAEPVNVAADVAPPTPQPFRFRTDAGGIAVADALASALPPAPEVPKSAPPKLRQSPLDRGEWPLPPVVAHVPTLPFPLITATRPALPPERAPRDLGDAAAEDLSHIAWPLPKSLPPPPKPILNADLPTLGQQVSSRAPVTDPTIALTTQRTIFTPLVLPEPLIQFVPFSIPDPFELQAHLRGNTGLARELAIDPADVPPAKP